MTHQTPLASAPPRSSALHERSLASGDAMKRNIVAISVAMSVVGVVSCGRGPGPEQRAAAPAVSSAAVAAPLVRINGYVIDVKGEPPPVPPGLDVADDALATGPLKVPLADVLARGQGERRPPNPR